MSTNPTEHRAVFEDMSYPGSRVPGIAQRTPRGEVLEDQGQDQDAGQPDAPATLSLEDLDALPDDERRAHRSEAFGALAQQQDARRTRGGSPFLAGLDMTPDRRPRYSSEP